MEVKVEVDDQIAILGKEGTGAAEIAAAATKAVEQVSIYLKEIIAGFSCGYKLIIDNSKKIITTQYYLRN